jgi:hypothetical protein
MISHTKVACEELLVMIPGEASILRHPAKRVSPIAATVHSQGFNALDSYLWEPEEIIPSSTSV